MGWPRKDQKLILYRDKDKKTYFMIMLPEDESHEGKIDAHIYYDGYDGIANILVGEEPSLCHAKIGVAYIANHWLKRMQWCDLPDIWKQAFTEYMERDGSTFNPKQYRGLWKVDTLKGQEVCYGSDPGCL